MMTVSDIYSFLWDLQENIGDGCKVEISIPWDGSLRFTVNWYDDELQYNYEVSAKFLEKIDAKSFVKIVADKINMLYRIKTVGEE